MITLRRRDKIADVSCDGCSSEEITVEDVEDIRSTLPHIRAEGWTMRQNANGEWKHYCADCSVAGNAKRRRQ